MSSVIRLCPKCGVEIPADAPEGACPGCLLESGLGLLADAFVAGVDSSVAASTLRRPAMEEGSAKPDDSGPVDKPVRDDVTPIPHGNKTARGAAVSGEFGDYELLEE